MTYASTFGTRKVIHQRKALSAKFKSTSTLSNPNLYKIRTASITSSTNWRELNLAQSLNYATSGCPLIRSKKSTKGFNKKPRKTFKKLSLSIDNLFSK